MLSPLLDWIEQGLFLPTIVRRFPAIRFLSCPCTLRFVYSITQFQGAMHRKMIQILFLFVLFVCLPKLTIAAQELLASGWLTGRFNT
jgi:hypothetical protein